MTYPSTATIKRLFAVSGNRCAFPNCTQSLVDKNSGKVTGEICHIKAQSAKGPRYDSEQTDKERHGFENLVLICPAHHQVVDSDISKYTVEHLVEIKKNHENGTIKINEPSDEVAEELINKILSKVTPQQRNLEYFEQLVKTGHWHQEFIANKELWICQEDNMFQIEVDDNTRDFSEPWTEVYPDTDHVWAIPIYLKINNVAVKELSFVACDGGRIFVPMPEIDFKDEKRSFYWNKESLDFNLAKILGKYYIYEDINGVAKVSKIEIR